VDWKKIKAEYIAGGTSYRKLAQKHGVSFNTLKTRAIEEQWFDLRQQKDNKTTTKIVETLSAKDADKAVNIIDVADKLLEKIVIIADSVCDADSIKKLTSALKDLKDIKGIKSEADIREQEARIAKLQKDVNEDNKDNEIQIIIGSEAEEYSV
jgi:transposase-like protein